MKNFILIIIQFCLILIMSYIFNKKETQKYKNIIIEMHLLNNGNIKFNN